MSVARGIRRKGARLKFHEGKLTAIVRRTPAKFDGNTWSTPDPDLTALLNDATAATPKTHTGLKQLAELVLRKVNLWDTAQILTAEQATQIEELPPGAIE
jgi:hypothetical protein